MTTANAAKSGSFKIGGDLAVHRLGLRRHARHRQGHMGRAGGSRGGAAHAASRARARHQPHRHGRQLRPGDQRAAHPRGAASLQRSRHRHQGRASASRPRCVGSRAASPTTCDSRYSSACVASASSASTSGNCTASTPACRAHEQFDAIAAMQKEGLIRHVGLSEVSVEEIQAAQKHFSVATRAEPLQSDQPFAATPSSTIASAHDIGFIPWFPLAAGNLARARLGARQDRSPSQRRAEPDRPRLAAEAEPGHAADPRHRQGEAPGGERRSGEHHAQRGGVRRAERPRLTSRRRRCIARPTPASGIRQ